MARRALGFLVSALACVTSVAWPGAARAEVRMTAPRGCGSVERLRARVAELAPGAPVDADVALEREVALVRARVRLTAPTTGERTLEGADCDSVVEAAALVIAMSGRLPAGPPASPKPDAPPAPAPAPTPAPAPAPSPPPAPARPRIRVHIAGFGAAVFGVLPSPGLGGGLLGGVTVAQVRGEIAVSAFASQRTAAASAPDVGGDFSLASATARGCVALTSGAPLTVAPCLGASVHRLAGDGFGATTTQSQTAWIAGPSAGGLVALSLGRALALRATGEAIIPTSRQPFVIGNVGSVHRPAGVFGRAELGVEVGF